MWISTKIEIHIYHKLSTIFLIPIYFQFSNVSCETSSFMIKKKSFVSRETLKNVSDNKVLNFKNIFKKDNI